MPSADTSDPAGRIKHTTQQAQNSKELPFRARLKGGTAQALMSAAAAVIAYLPTRPLGLHEGFWGSITAIAVGRIAADDAARPGRKSDAGYGKRAIEVAVLILERPVRFGAELCGNGERTRGIQQQNRGYSRTHGLYGTRPGGAGSQRQFRVVDGLNHIRRHARECERAAHLLAQSC